MSKKSDNSRKYTYDVEVNSFKFPVKEGDIVGKVVVKDKDTNKKITSVDLTVLEDIDSLSYIELFYKGFKDLFSGNYTFSFVE